MSIEPSGTPGLDWRSAPSAASARGMLRPTPCTPPTTANPPAANRAACVSFVPSSPTPERSANVVPVSWRNPPDADASRGVVA